MRTLVLNAGYEPLAVVSFKRALLLVMNQKATVILHEEGNPVCARQRLVGAPERDPAHQVRAHATSARACR